MGKNLYKKLYLGPWKQFLEELSKRTGKSASSIVRNALEQYENGGDQK